MILLLLTLYCKAIIIFSEFDLPVLNEQVGLALSYAAPIVSLLGSFLTSFTETEKEMVSVERILQVTKFIYIHKSFITQIEISFLLHIL